MDKRILKDIKNLAYRFRDDDVTALASELAYSLLISFFPMLIFIMTLIGFSSLNSSEVLRGLSQILPSSLFELVKSTVVDVVETRNHNLLSLSLILTIWISSTGFKAVIKGVNRAYDEPERRSVIKLEVIAILCTLALTLIIFMTLALLVLGEVIGRNLGIYLGHTDQFMAVWNIFRYIIILSAMVFVFAALYRYTPSRRMTWLEVIPGAIFATGGWVAASMVFSFYVNNFGNYTNIYGSIGVIIMLLTWLFLTSVIIIMGGEVNATLAFDHEGKEKPVGKKY
ncbi:MAG: ribonuclease [Firmicutes bacterium]|nr:ribonuclease [Bacillota bacterium]